MAVCRLYVPCSGLFEHVSIFGHRMMKKRRNKKWKRETEIAD
ncbi:hypothetical protein MC28_F001 (plasmid) [Bacillus thuringiensis MC28]|nr:hypothetical protein MC28_F001 [Bacillus thuringiensis MC28]